MRRAKVTTAAPPLDRASAITSQRMHTVHLGNHRVVHFTSSRRALEFQAQATRFLTDALMSANLLLSEAFVSYRMAWPYLDNSSGTKDQPNPAELVRDAWRSLDLASNKSDTSNATYFRWKHITDALGAVRTMALALEKMYSEKSQAVPRHAMLVLAKRSRELADELRDFGSDVDTSV